MNEPQSQVPDFDPRPPEPGMAQKGVDRRCYLARVQSIDPEQSNMDCFDQAVGVILRELYRHHPFPVSIDTRKMVESPAILPSSSAASSSIHFEGRLNLINCTIDFLYREGFITMPEARTSSPIYSQVSLTLNGLNALRVVPSSLPSKAKEGLSFGEQLVQESLKSAVGGLVTGVFAQFASSR